MAGKISVGKADIPEAKVVDGEYSTIRSSGGKLPMRKMFSAIKKGFDSMFRTWEWSHFGQWLAGMSLIGVVAGLCFFGFQACERRDNQQQELRLIYINKCIGTTKDAYNRFPNYGG